mgnify:CR=1 FL=1
MPSSLPLIRLSAINPFLLELRRRGVGVGGLLRDLGLPEDIPASQELFVAPTAIYEFVERSAEIAGDPYLGFTVGSALDLDRWDPIADAAEDSNTVGELLTLFIVNAADHSSASRFFLRTDGARSTFGLERIKTPAFRQGQNDAFYMGFMSRMLSHATREYWDARKVMFRVADTACIPSTSENFRVAQGDPTGIRISFPSQWLLERFENSRFRAQCRQETSRAIPRSLLESVHRALKPHLHETDLTVERAAKICGYNRRRLARELRAEGTTISKEIAKLRASKAEEELGHPERRVAEVAQCVGFTDPTVFSRAFKNWTGQSPQEYRRTHRAPG